MDVVVALPPLAEAVFSFCEKCPFWWNANALRSKQLANELGGVGFGVVRLRIAIGVKLSYGCRDCAVSAFLSSRETHKSQGIIANERRNPHTLYPGCGSSRRCASSVCRRGCCTNNTGRDRIHSLAPEPAAVFSGRLLPVGIVVVVFEEGFFTSIYLFIFIRGLVRHWLRAATRPTVYRARSHRVPVRQNQKYPEVDLRSSFQNTGKWDPKFNC